MGRKAESIGNYDHFRTFDEFISTVKIPERKWAFFQALIDEKSQTFGNAVKSYHAAGYAENSTSKYRARDLYHSPMMQRLLTLWHQKTAERRENRNLGTFDRVHNDLLWALDLAKARMDYTAVRSIAMDIAKLHGLLVDKHQVLDPMAQAEIDKAVQIEAARLAEQRLLQSPAQPETNLADTIIDAQFEAPFDADCPTDLSNVEPQTVSVGL